jgi:hypothetical protein
MRQRFWHGERPVLSPLAPTLKSKRLHWNINALACFRACSGYLGEALGSPKSECRVSNVFTPKWLRTVGMWRNRQIIVPGYVG